MPRIELQTEIKADRNIVFDLSRSIDLHKISTEQTNEEAIAGKTSGLIGMNESVTWRAKHFGIYQNLTSKITEFDKPNYFADEMVKGAFAEFKHKHHFTESNGGTLMTDFFDYKSPLGILGKLADKLFLKKYMTELLTERNRIVKEFAELNPDEEKIKNTINELLFNAGNYNVSALDSMVSDKAMLGISSLKDGTWSNSEIAIHDFFDSIEKRERSPYYEIPIDYNIIITEGQIALARADCILYRWGIPQSREVNHFTFIKENGKWKILNISWTKKELTEEQTHYDMEIFARGYAQAWCSQRPNFVSSFFAEDGELTVNNGEPARGTLAISNVAKGFMDAFPDMIITMDSLITKSDKTRFYWTLTGTNNGHNGTGNKVKISGFEEWTLNDKGLIQKSTGSFDENEYKRQIEVVTN